jgi:hypothetical protein
MIAEQFQTPPRPNRLNLQNNAPNVERGISRLVKAKDIARKIKSFDHFLYVWGGKGGYFMPPKSALSWHYISQILAGEKKLLLIKDVGHVQELPKSKGLLVRSLWEKWKHLNALHSYLPEITEQTQVPRTYFFNVV